MNSDAFKDIEKLETDLWEAADNLRANSKLTSSDYFMPVLGIIFLRHAALLHDSTAARVGALFQLLVQDTTAQDFGLPSSAIRLRM